VVTDVGALPASVARTGAGWSVPAGSVDALADAITAAFRDPDAWQRASDGAREVAVDQSPARVGAALRAIYAEVARSR
jgi:glycosyltransferase involved in cell wall biosynthesis